MPATSQEVFAVPRSKEIKKKMEKNVKTKQPMSTQNEKMIENPSAPDDLHDHLGVHMSAKQSLKSQPFPKEATFLQKKPQAHLQQKRMQHQQTYQLMSRATLTA